MHFILQNRRVHSAETLSQKKKTTSKNSLNKTGLTSEQQRIVASAKAQFERRGGFVRIFPSPKSWEMYAQYLGESFVTNIFLIIFLVYFTKELCII